MEIKPLNVLDQEIETYSLKAKDYAISKNRDQVIKCRDLVIELYTYKKTYYKLDREERNTLKLLKILKRGQKSTILRNKLMRQIKK